MTQSEWVLADQEGVPIQQIVFGIHGARPVVGDWNGDGKSKVGVFLGGQWFLDLNGDGTWDAGDLWAQLGEDGDFPITGDWDGDGKTDIGVFGPMWPGDERALVREPGQPAPKKRPRTIIRTSRLDPQPSHLGPAGPAAHGGRAAAGRRDRPRVPLRDGGRHSRGRRLDRQRRGHHRRVPRRRVVPGHRRRRPLEHRRRGRSLRPARRHSRGRRLERRRRNQARRVSQRHVVPGRAQRARPRAAHQGVHLGHAGDVPVVGDWTGDGISKPGVYHDGRTDAGSPRTTGPAHVPAVAAAPAAPAK